jgi:hypothetical protein
VRERRRPKDATHEIFSGACSFNDTTPLIAATATNHPEIAQLLLEHVANVNVRTGFDASGPTALRLAAHFGYDLPMTLLLADVPEQLRGQDLQIEWPRRSSLQECVRVAVRLR